MLYDNALLTLAYLEGYQATHDEKYARIVRETLDYILHDLTDPSGMFHSTEDADSEGEEGKFYVWTPKEIYDVLGDDRGVRFCYVYDVSDQGNFEHGQSILNLPKTIEQCASLRGWDVEQVKRELAEDRSKLLEVRSRRVRPSKDDKVLVSWNALMIDAMARASGVLGEPKYLAAAKRATQSLLKELRRPDGRLLHAWRHGKAKLDGYLDDYTYLINALVSLYETSFEEQWIGAAVQLADMTLAHFRDPAGGFFYTADDHEQLIARHKDLQDGSVPSGNSMAAYGLLRLGKLIGRTDYLDAAQQTIESALGILERSPTAAGQMLLAADLAIGPTQELVFVGPADEELRTALRARFLPRTVVAWRSDTGTTASPLDSLFADRAPGKELALYVCENFTCQAPVVGREGILAKLESM
jgi:uncharacterized protein YyaL (SSP411 family)